MRAFRPAAWYALVSILAIGYLFPLVWMFVASVRDPRETTDEPTRCFRQF